MENKIYREVSVPGRLPLKNGGVICICDPADGLQQLYFQDGEFVDPADDYPMPVTAWLELVSLDYIQDKRDLTATFFVNSIRLLDEQGARHLVKELCERFHLLPTDDELIFQCRNKTSIRIKSFLKGANYILNKLKGVKR